jgi:BirA family biotin operon repressor/biotin-[acetyl-CoA-carboxylase] ligase
MVPLDLHNPWDGAPVLRRERTGSTMEDALALARKGYPGGTTVVADYQEAGRGRLPERTWRSEAGQNLLFTQLLRGVLAGEPHRLPLLVGLAVARTLEGLFGLHPEIKWPNDVLCPLKVAGILCEAVSDASGVVLLAGVGLNCNQLEFPGEPGATSLAVLLGRPVDRMRTLERILAEIRHALTDRGWKEALLARLHRLGREVALREGVPRGGPGDGTLCGVLEGLEENGALRIRLPGGRVRFVYSGELTAT